MSAGLVNELDICLHRRSDTRVATGESATRGAGMRYRVLRFWRSRRQSQERLRLGDGCTHRRGALDAPTAMPVTNGQLFPCEEGGEAIRIASYSFTRLRASLI